MVSEVYEHQWTFIPVKQDDLQSLHLCFIWSSRPREFPTKQHPTSNRQVEVSWSRVPFGNVPGYQFVSWCVPGTLKKHHAQCILSLYRNFYVGFCSQTRRCIHIHLHLFALLNFEEGIWRFHFDTFFLFWHLRTIRTFVSAGYLGSQLAPGSYSISVLVRFDCSDGRQHSICM